MDFPCEDCGKDTLRLPSDNGCTCDTECPFADPDPEVRIQQLEAENKRQAEWIAEARKLLCYAEPARHPNNPESTENWYPRREALLKGCGE